MWLSELYFIASMNRLGYITPNAKFKQIINQNAVAFSSKKNIYMLKKYVHCSATYTGCTTLTAFNVILVEALKRLPQLKETTTNYYTTYETNNQIVSLSTMKQSSSSILLTVEVESKGQFNFEENRSLLNLIINTINKTCEERDFPLTKTGRVSSVKTLNFSVGELQVSEKEDYIYNDENNDNGSSRFFYYLLIIIVLSLFVYKIYMENKGEEDVGGQTYQNNTEQNSTEYESHEEDVDGQTNNSETISAEEESREEDEYSTDEPEQESEILQNYDWIYNKSGGWVGTIYGQAIGFKFYEYGEVWASDASGDYTLRYSIDKDRKEINITLYTGAPLVLDIDLEQHYLYINGVQLH